MGMLGQKVKASVENGVNLLLREVGDTSLSGMEELRLTVEQPGQLRHGDYATNAPLQLAKRLRLPPMKLAEQLAHTLRQDPWLGSIMARIETAPPGFVNFYVDWRVWAISSFQLPPVPSGKVIIEHTSINPNKSAHVGHLRNSCIGDTLGRLLKRLGHEVEIHNYIDDLGNQLADTVVGLLKVPMKGKHQRFGDYCWDVYPAVNRRYEEEAELAEERSRVLHALEEGGSNLAWLGTLAAERIVKEHLEEMAGFRIDYNLLVWESNIVREGFWDAAAQLLESTGLFVQVKEGKLAGCRILKQDDKESLPDSEYVADKVLVRSNGILTYTAKDIAYHLWKFGLLNRNFRYQPWGGGLWTTAGEGGENLPFGRGSMVINVIDQRQEYPQAVVKQVLAALGFHQQAENLRHVAYGVVSLSPAAAAELGVDISSGKASYAMSGRQGIGIRNSTLLARMEQIIRGKQADKTNLSISSQELAAAAIRYYLLRYNLQTEVVFDLEQATEVTGNTGVYLMYAYARSCNVLNKAKEASGPVDITVPESFPLLALEEHALLRHLSGWQETLTEAGTELSPHLIANYAFELAALFNQFYAHCPILKAKEEALLRFRLWLTERFREALGDALQVLGLPAPESM